VLGFLTPLAALLGLELEETKERLQHQTLFWGIIVLMSLIALVFLLIAANTGLTTVVGPIWAPLIIAGVALVLALIVFFIARDADAEAKALNEERRRETAATVRMAANAAASTMPVLLKSGLVRKVGIPALAAAAAYFLTRSRD
jgi:choline-glycine betaine transporter